MQIAMANAAVSFPATLPKQLTIHRKPTETPR